MGQYLVEWFRSAITVFQILTTADFWKGMGNALIGIFLSAVGFLQKGIAEAIEIARPLAGIFGRGDKLVGGPERRPQTAVHQGRQLPKADPLQAQFPLK